MAPKIDPKQINDLIINLNELTARVDNLSTANSKTDENSSINILTEAVKTLTLKIDTLACSTEENHTSITNDIASIRNTIIKNLQESHFI